MSCEIYSDDIREAARLKIKSHSAPTPEIMTETDIKLRAAIQKISENYNKPYRDVQNDVYDIFSQEWERRMLQEERRKASTERQRIFKNMDRQEKNRKENKKDLR